ncbi:MAG: SDR family NAD(P)-dependent oxidoreductase [bacterium]
MSFYPKTVAIFGSTGTIGSSLLSLFENESSVETIHAFCRTPQSVSHPKTCLHQLDITSESDFDSVSASIPNTKSWNLILICTGILHSDTLQPEKTIRQCSAKNIRHVFDINTIAPLLIAKYFLPYLNPSDPSIFSAISARVGSISDNRLGGWYSYRASKAALNMVIKTLSIEASHFFKNTTVIGLHPGTVVSKLSKPFLSNPSLKTYMTGHESSSHLRKVLDQVSLSDSGHCFAWDGSKIPA